MKYLILILSLALVLPMAEGYAMGDDQGREPVSHASHDMGPMHDCCDDEGNDDRAGCGEDFECSDCTSAPVLSAPVSRFNHQKPGSMLLMTEASSLHESHSLPPFRPPIA